MSQSRTDLGPQALLSVNSCLRLHVTQTPFLTKDFLFSYTCPVSPAPEGLSLVFLWRVSLGDLAFLDTSVLGEWQTSLLVLLAPTPPTLPPRNVSSVPVAATAFQG